MTRARAGSSAKTELRLDIPKWVYRYETYPGKWMRILPRASTPGDGHVEEPQARYAHQLAYDPKTGQAFMHGGNGGVNPEVSTQQSKPEGEAEGEDGTRLDDFWSMRLERCGRSHHGCHQLTVVAFLGSHLKKSYDEPRSRSEHNSTYGLQYPLTSDKLESGLGFARCAKSNRP